MGQGVEHVALVLAQVRRLFQEISPGSPVLFDDGIVTGSDVVLVDFFSGGVQVVEFEIAVAFHARIRGNPLFVGVDKALDDFLLEFLSEIVHQKIDAQPIGYADRIVNAVQAATGLGTADTDGFIIIKAHGDAGGFVSGFPNQVRRNAAVHTAAHGHENFFRH